ncbi:class I SAM-dependent methyltransferase [Oryzifoliimicrobium ureilyticus]|uniref:class I SAM-dependent methyltransferase n=1 Tax=Oryzifoliimicrobium ureilyticus TaxID=3113724 RepID=UPI0030767BCB
MTQISASPPEHGAHAALMDGMYRYQRHIYDLTRKYYLFGRDTTIRGLGIENGGSLLEVACGTGRNLALAHRHFPQAELHGFDISEEMLISARATLARKGINAQLHALDATRFSPANFNRTGFERIMISYALSMIPDWEAALDSAIDALCAGGQLHIVDFGQQEGLPPAVKKLLQAWLAKFHVHPRKMLRANLERRAEMNKAQFDFQSIGAGYAWRLVYTAR